MDDDFIDDGWDGDEYGEDWPDDDAPAETLPCPACGADIYEEAEQCPACGEYVVRQTGALSGKSNWYVAAAILGIIAVIVALLRYF